MRSAAAVSARAVNAFAVATIAAALGCTNAEVSAPTFVAGGESSSLTGGGSIKFDSKCGISKILYCLGNGTAIYYTGGGVSISDPTSNYELDISAKTIDFKPEGNLLSPTRVTIHAREATFRLTKFSNNGRIEYSFSRVVPSGLITETGIPAINGLLTEVGFPAMASLVIRTDKAQGAFSVGPAGAKFGGEDWGFATAGWGVTLHSGTLSITAQDDWESPIMAEDTWNEVATNAGPGDAAVRLLLNAGVLVNAADSPLRIGSLDPFSASLSIKGGGAMSIQADCAKLCVPGVSGMVLSMGTGGKTTVVRDVLTLPGVMITKVR